MASNVKNQDAESEELCDSVCHGIALAELIAFMEESQSDSSIGLVFKLSELSKSYVAKLEKLGIDVSQHVHSTRLNRTMP